MSPETVAWALSAPVPWSGAKFVLVALAATSDDAARCVTTVSGLARLISADRRAAQRRLDWLEAKGWVERQPSTKGRCSTTIFVLTDPRTERKAA